ncbi:CBM9 family sugar-binding protein [Reichenbachiella versicolor]|uniref:CBM9 family sugar-binding protein n=1 Tax=Reichenbachiella versicolor TaxID=1821036 RepID=UPI001C87A012|nr:CBM9 family sugar-binding protein [Reichenbachiella versicolor]
MKSIYIFVFMIGFSSCQSPNIHDYKYQIIQSSSTISIDGIGNEDTWTKAKWLPIDQNWVGPDLSKEDFSGRFKLAWDQKFLYVLAEIVDDTLIDIHSDPLKAYWDDDCLEIFIDEDLSGGNHQYNHSAFAYHIGLDNNVADIDTNQKPVLFNDHIESKRISSGNKHTWEVAIKIFNEDFSISKRNTPTRLTALKEMGFAIAYCDNDYSSTRENFIGSEIVVGEDKNRGWIDAGIFGSLILIPEK